MSSDEVWDPFGTIGQALWIGGGQWAGKTTVSRILAHRLDLTAYHADYANAHGHHERALARGDASARHDPESLWVTRRPREMADEVLADFTSRFDWILDDLRALVSPHPVLVDGWAARPELIVPRVAAPERMVVMVPTGEFRRRQLRELPRAGRLGAADRLSDPELGQRNRVERDRLVAADAVDAARARGVAVIEVDGSRDAEAVADLVEERFAPLSYPAAGVRR